LIVHAAGGGGDEAVAGDIVREGCAGQDEEGRNKCGAITDCGLRIAD
jgi:hypothetical protein